MALTVIEPQSAYARDAPWIGIGVRGAWKHWQDALVDAKLDFEVTPYPAKVELSNPLAFGTHAAGLTMLEVVPGVQVNVDNNNRILGCVSSQYGIIQNKDAFSLLQPLLDDGAIITNAGMTEQGLCFMVAVWETTDILGEEWNYNIMCTNSFNSQFPCALIMVPTRIICQNMYRKVLKQNDAMLHIRHMSLAPKRIEEAKLATSKCMTYMDSFNDVINQLSDGVMSTGDIQKLIEIIFPMPPKHAERYESSKARVLMQREEFVDSYILSPTIARWRDKPVGFLHAYYDYLSHRGQTKNMPGDWSNRRLSTLVSGDAVNTNVVNAIKNL